MQRLVVCLKNLKSECYPSPWIALNKNKVSLFGREWAGTTLWGIRIKKICSLFLHVQDSK